MGQNTYITFTEWGQLIRIYVSYETELHRITALTHCVCESPLLIYQVLTYVKVMFVASVGDHGKTVPA